MAGQTVISVNKQRVAELLQNGKVHKFVIPEYQRPYSWTETEATTLFEDITEFSLNTGGTQHDGALYFLGSIVSYINDNNEAEIIDGQQRLTSLFLLLRAILYKLEHSNDNESDQAQHFIREISTCLWDADKLTGKSDRTKPLIRSMVINNDGNAVLHTILAQGVADQKAKDNYSKNYRLFQSLIDTFCSHYPLSNALYNFIYALLNQVVILPITADSQDTALTIFSTLNNRGLPLSHADIFKAKIYNSLSEQDKKAFVEQWKEIEQDAMRIELRDNITSLFTYYMPYLRAKEGDKDTTSPSVRKYYLDKKCERLYQRDLLSQLTDILNIWKVIYTNYDIAGEHWDNNPEIRQALDILVSYPNDYIKYPMLIFYLAHHKEDDFEHTFLLFLRKLIYECLMRFVQYPSINAIKNYMPKFNVDVLATNHPSFEASFTAPIQVSEQEFKENIIHPHYRLLSMLLKIQAYNHQPKSNANINNCLLPANWQIEHIFPRKYDSHFFKVEDPGVIEHIGNKIPFERELNIQAGNNFFSEKCKKYASSNVQVVRDLTQHEEWTVDQIRQRDVVVTNEIWATLKAWNDAYMHENPAKVEQPSDLSKEELALMDKLRAKGYKI